MILGYFALIIMEEGVAGGGFCVSTTWTIFALKKGGGVSRVWEISSFLAITVDLLNPI